MPSERIAYYDGNNWHSFNNDLINAELNHITFYNDELYICGGFTMIGNDTTIRRVAKWNNALPSRTSNLLNEDNIFSIFPNPATAQFTLNTNDLGYLAITNQLGQIVFSSSVNKENIEINTSIFPKGIYFVQLTTTQNTSTKKIVIQ